MPPEFDAVNKANDLLAISENASQAMHRLFCESAVWAGVHTGWAEAVLYAELVSA